MKPWSFTCCFLNEFCEFVRVVRRGCAGKNFGVVFPQKLVKLEIGIVRVVDFSAEFAHHPDK